MTREWEAWAIIDTEADALVRVRLTDGDARHTRWALHMEDDPRIIIRRVRVVLDDETGGTR
jgi:hypothetical protein